MGFRMMRFFYDANETAGGGATPPPAKDHSAEMAEMRKTINKLKSENGRLAKQFRSGGEGGSNGGGGGNNMSLGDKVKRDRQNESRNQNESKAIEESIKYNLGVNGFVDENKDLLPSEISAIIKEADKITYDSHGQKSLVLKQEILQSFFSVKENRDFLTNYQKQTLEDFEKLTKNGKEAKVETLYRTVFEPALESLRRVRKADEVNRARNGFSKGSSAQEAFQDKIIKGSRKHYLKEKE